MNHTAAEPHRPNPLLILAAVALVAVALLAGCRRDEDGEPTASPSPSGSAPTASESPEVTATASPGVTPAGLPLEQQPPGPRTETATLVVDGREREWRLYVPSTLPSGPAPLVVGLHGGFGNGAQFARTARFDEQAEEGGFLAAYPEGTGAIPTWNGGRCCGYAVRENVDDVAFIEAMVDAISRQYVVDAARVYAVGHSNGGIMALRLACESDRFIAAGAVAGSLEVGGCAPTRSVSMLLIHGDADENHPLGGGRGPLSVANVDFTSVADSMAVLAPAMGCSEETSDEVSGVITTTSWAGCPRGVAVQLKVIAGASHAWPGGVPGLNLGGEPNDLLDATQALWDFFSHLERV